MAIQRSAEYTKYVLDVFKASDDELRDQLEIVQNCNEPVAIYVGDITNAEREFLLLQEVAFRLAYHPHTSEEFHAQLTDLANGSV
ncbi:hypothetical protein H0W80_03580 [Candidatus Saccharibacteria bacterium]|nr:hypothetical protein [Candidatus Saccharibacteria bacterium]